MKKILFLLLLSTSAYGANPQYGYNKNNIKLVGNMNDSALQTHEVISTSKGKDFIAVSTEERSYNGGKFIVAGVNGISAYTAGGNVILYQTESDSNTYKGRVNIIGDKYMVFTATKNGNTWEKTTEVFDKNGNPTTSTINAKIQTVSEPKTHEYSVKNTENEKGYYQTVTVDNQSYTVKTGDKLDTQAINSRVDGLEYQLNNQQYQIHKLDKKVTRGISSITALTALHPNARSNSDNQVSIGTGIYSGHQSVAVGTFHYLNNDVLLNTGLSYGGETAVKAGVTFGF